MIATVAKRLPSVATVNDFERPRKLDLPREFRPRHSLATPENPQEMGSNPTLSSVKSLYLAAFLARFAATVAKR